MLPRLAKSERLNNELNDFRKKSKYLDEDKQIKVLDKINQIKKLAENVDVSHDANYNGFINPSLLNDTRNDINRLRLEITRILNNG